MDCFLRRTGDDQVIAKVGSTVSLRNMTSTQPLVNMLFFISINLASVYNNPDGGFLMPFTSFDTVVSI